MGDASLSDDFAGNEQYMKTHNLARFFVENRQIGWVLLVASLVWGLMSYRSMPQRKDPEIPIPVAAVVVPWPGANPEDIEQQVVRKVEQAIAGNDLVTEINSTCRNNVAIITFRLEESVKNTDPPFDDIKIRLDAIQDLPDGAGPIRFIKDFGDATTIMMVVASPQISDIESKLHSEAVQKAIEKVRADADAKEGGERISIVFGFPVSVPIHLAEGAIGRLQDYLEQKAVVRDARVIRGSGFIGIDAQPNTPKYSLEECINVLHSSELRQVAMEVHPDVWAPAVICKPSETAEKLAEVSADKYSYRELDDFADTIRRSLLSMDEVGKVETRGLLNERIYLLYSQERLASYGLSPLMLPKVIGARNTTIPGGLLDVAGTNMLVSPSGEFASEKEIGDVLLPTESGVPVYLRDLVDIQRGYESPAMYKNFYTWRDMETGEWHRTRAVTLGIYMRDGLQIGHFGNAVDTELKKIRQLLPDDLIIAKTSDQPLQVKEKIDDFMVNLYVAIALVIIVVLVGFWEWRAAVLIALCIPLALSLTFGMMSLCGLDLQQISISSLILALGLLVDDPVVASDAIKRELQAGVKRKTAAWIGPTKLSNALYFTTATNIVAYLPLLLLGGLKSDFIFSMPVVLTMTLISSRIVSMTFVPLLGYYFLKPGKAPRLSVTSGGRYRKVALYAIEHRRKLLPLTLTFLMLGFFLLTITPVEFFPTDYSYLSYVDVWLPEDATLNATNDAAIEVEKIIQRVATDFGKTHPDKTGTPRKILNSLTTYIGGGGPRFWFSISPEISQLNYAQVIIRLNNKLDTSKLVGPLQAALSRAIPGVRADVRQLETGPPVGVPVSIRFVGENMQALRKYAEQAKQILRSVPCATGIRDDWGRESLELKLDINADRANAAGVTNAEIAAAAGTGLSGAPISILREGRRQIPIVARLRFEERTTLDDLRNLYVYGSSGTQVPLNQVASVAYEMQGQKIVRFNQFRAITASCFATNGHLASEVMDAARPRLEALNATLPAGYSMSIIGEEKDRNEAFSELKTILIVCVLALYMTLVFQLRHWAKPFIAFASIPFGMAGAFCLLKLLGAPFGFMAFIGIVSLVGLIAGQVIILSDFIENIRATGAPLLETLVGAGSIRMRPLLVAVASTVFGLIPLSLSGGPFWEPLTYVQIGGLVSSAAITLILVPMLYALFVLDLKVFPWEHEESGKPDDVVETSDLVQVKEANAPEAGQEIVPAQTNQEENAAFDETNDTTPPGDEECHCEPEPDGKDIEL